MFVSSYWNVYSQNRHRCFPIFTQEGFEKFKKPRDGGLWGVGGEGYPMSSSHANIKMKKGERVWIRTYGSYGQYAEGGHWSNFSGIKL